MLPNKVLWFWKHPNVSLIAVPGELLPQVYPVHDSGLADFTWQLGRPHQAGSTSVFTPRSRPAARPASKVCPHVHATLKFHYGQTDTFPPNDIFNFPSVFSTMPSTWPFQQLGNCGSKAPFLVLRGTWLTWPDRTDSAGRWLSSHENQGSDSRRQFFPKGSPQPDRWRNVSGARYVLCCTWTLRSVFQILRCPSLEATNNH